MKDKFSRLYDEKYNVRAPSFFLPFHDSTVCSKQMGGALIQVHMCQYPVIGIPTPTAARQGSRSHP